MKILLIPDKFKGSLTAEEAILAMTNGIKRSIPHAQIHSILASDGGDGFLHAIGENINGKNIVVDTFDPLNRNIKANYLWHAESKSAYIEMAKASGLELLDYAERNVMYTSTFGTGILINNAVNKGATSIFLGLGGSATNDAGIGIAAALGYDFLDELGNKLKPIGGNLSKIKSIQKNEEFLDLDGINFFAVNDVDNPLYGETGASYTYAEQKGASKANIEALDKGLKEVSVVINKQLGIDVVNISGAGAAGGAAYGLKVFCQAEFVTGVDFVLGLAKVNELLSQQEFDYIITGEGKFDNQTLHGKLIKGVLNLGKSHNIPVIAVCGQLDVPLKDLRPLGFEAVLEIKNAAESLSYNMKNAKRLLENKILTYFRK